MSDRIRCPLCGVGEIDLGEAVEASAILASVKPGAPSPHELYERTGGGDAFRAAMIEWGYVKRIDPAPPA